MNEVTAIIADDEVNLSRHLSGLLETTWPELNIVGTAKNGSEALAMISQYEPDVVFLDIRMPGLSGLDVASQLPENTAVVFVTAYDEYATDAFEKEAVDYLLKPATKERILETVKRLKQRMTQKNFIDPLALGDILNRSVPKKEDYLQWLPAGTGDLVELVSVEKVIYLKAGGKYCSVFTAEKEHLIRTPIAELETRLDPKQFWRIHRGTLVNVTEIQSAKRDLRGRYAISLRHRPEKLIVSNTYAHLFKTM